VKFADQTTRDSRDLLAESPANVGKIRPEYKDFFADPLKLKGLEGSPARAFAVKES
jgi:kynurenine formamidase